jgi:hypothetical protein
MCGDFAQIVVEKCRDHSGIFRLCLDKFGGHPLPPRPAGEPRNPPAGGARWSDLAVPTHLKNTAA